MAVNVTGEDALAFIARISTESFEQSIEVMVKGFDETTAAAVRASGAQAKAYVDQNKALTELGKDATAEQIKQQKLLQTLIDFGRAQKLVVEVQEDIKRLQTKGKLIDPQDAEQLQLNIRLLKQYEADLLNLGKSAAVSANALIKNTAPPPPPPPVPPVPPNNLATILGADLFKEIKSSYGEVDEVTKKFILDTILVTQKLQDLKQAEVDLQNAFNAGTITQKDYIEGIGLLVAGTKGLEEESSRLNKTQAAYQDDKTIKVIAQKEKAIQELRKAYSELTFAQQDGEQGFTLEKKAAQLAKEIDGLNPQKITGVGSSISSARAELTKLNNLIVTNPGSPMLEGWTKRAIELKDAIKNSKTELEQAGNSVAGLDAFASGLRGLVGGFTAITGVVGLFTTDTAKMEEVTKNAASALAFLNGVQEVSNVLAKTGALNRFLVNSLTKAGIVLSATETAAVQANAVAMALAAGATQAEALAAGEAAVATSLLNAAMLSNPAVLLVVAIAALVAGYILLTDGTTQAEKATKRLAEEQKTVNEGLNEQKVKLEALVAVLKQGNLSFEQQQALYEDFKKVSPEVVAGLDAQGVSYDNLVPRIANFLAALETQLRMEAKIGKLRQSLAEEDALQTKINTAAKNEKDGNFFSTVAYSNEKDRAQKKLNAQKLITAEIGKEVEETQKLKTANDAAAISFAEAQKGKLQKLDEELKKATKLRYDSSSDAKAYAKNSKEVLRIEAEIKAITGKTAAEVKSDNSAAKRASTKAQREQNKEERAYNKELERQKNLLETIEGLKRGAVQSGLLESASELDRINEKYDQAIAKIKEFNSTARPKLQISTNVLNDARATELQNATYIKNAEDFKKTIDDQRKYYENYEEDKLKIGKEKSALLYADLLKGGETYLASLEQQKKNIMQSVDIGATPDQNIEQKLKVQAIDKEIADTKITNIARASQAERDEQIKVLEATMSYNNTRKAIEEQYQRDINALGKIATGDDYVLRLQLLKKAREEQLKVVDDTAFQELEIYKRLNGNISALSRGQVNEAIKQLRELTKKDAKTTDSQGNIIGLTADQIAQLNEMIKRLKEARKAKDELFGVSAADFAKAADIFNAVGDAASTLSDTLREGGKTKLANVLEGVGEIAKVAGDAATLGVAIATGDIAGIISGAVKVITGLFSLGKKRREREAKEEAEKQAALTKQFIAEKDINALYRERELSAARVNKLKLEGLKAEALALTKNKAAAQKDYEDTLKQLQGTVIKAKGRRGASSTPYANAAFDDLEKLFMAGKLEGKAKDLFEQLQKIKNEGVDIDAALAENKLRAQEVFTGTTSDSILDSIVQGFADGKRASADFAGNFEELMKKSILNSFKYQALEAPLKKFYADFAAAAESDGILTAAEIAQLQASYNATIKAAGAQFDQLQAITNINFANSAALSGNNSLQGAVKSITQEQADLLAGQFGGLRLTAFETLNVAKLQLTSLNAIAANTSLLVDISAYLQHLRNVGIKII